jgi:hypothetical protein
VDNLLILSSGIVFASEVFVVLVAKRYKISRLYANRELVVSAVYILGR